VSGTGFYISGNLILTAAHVVKMMHPAHIWAGAPGEANVIYDTRRFLNEQCAVKHRCKIVLDMSTGIHEADIAILQTDLVSPSVTLDFTTPLDNGHAVDIIGYPSGYNALWLEKRHPDIQGDKNSAYVKALTLLPQNHLMVSAGIIVDDDDGTNPYNPSYKVTTAPGMSGGLVCIDGRVVGMLPNISLTRLM
jgi:hypothetical protein